MKRAFPKTAGLGGAAVEPFRKGGVVVEAFCKGGVVVETFCKAGVAGVAGFVVVGSVGHVLIGGAALRSARGGASQVLTGPFV